MTTTQARRPTAPPGPSRAAALRWLSVMNRDRLGMLAEAAGQYGDAARIPVGHKTLYLFNHPDHAKHVLADNAANYHKGIGLVHARRALGDGLLTSEGELWRKQRKVIQPAFQSKRIAAQAGAIALEAQALVTQLRTFEGQGPVDVVGEMTGLTLGVLGRTLLDADLGTFASIGAMFGVVQDQAMYELETLSAVPAWLPTSRQRRFRQARQNLEGIVDQLVEQRRARTEDRDDVLSRLIVSTDQETDPGVGRMRLRDELVTLLLAGHETTASTLSWTLYLIDEHPQVWQRLHDEAVRVLGDRLPEYEDLHQLRYTAMVVEEVMRMYPPVWLLPRIALADDEVGGYHVPAGADVLISPYTLHRHPRFWEDPTRFDPDRFDPSRSGERPRYAFIPFGAGPRFCVGNHLGMMEATFVIALLARELRLERAPGYEVVPEPMLSLRIRGGLPMTVRSAR
ncbi:cytochrome P450 [Catellatospora methionotrophica]|uniref:Cytochrome P450 n=1 Tax=Catellatospora methionotrophica TaxID=121620 RepID=A0A8J3LAB6_9ACTN|nr:cytochrome P450 [Catellatospora methionotrophica]GIG15337.1 cytochrome P450 [Catellatospora methionotrophica]